MTTFQPYVDFTAQGKNVVALNSLYAQLKREPDINHEITPMVVFLAFSIESYLNSVGSRKIEIWDELERMPWKSKLIILHKTAKKDIDWGQDPLQFATEVFSLRDKLAHGKPERVLGPTFESESKATSLLMGPLLEPAWYKGLTKERADKSYSRFGLLMLYIGSLFDLHESDHCQLATGGIISDDHLPA